MKAQNWNELSNSEISEDSIRSLFPDRSKHRLSRSEYKPGERYTGTLATPATVIVQRGSCRYVIDGNEITIERNEFVKVHPGNYQFQADSTEGASIFKIYEITLSA